MSPTRRPKGDGTLFKRSDGLWVAGIDIPTTDGKRRQKRVTAKDRLTAIDKLRKLRAELAAGHVTTSGNVTLEKWLEHWLTTIRGPHIKPTTYTSYANTIRLYISPLLGGKRVDKLTPEDVRRMQRALRTDLVEKGEITREASTRNAQKAHQVLEMALKDALNEGLVVRNVAAVVPMPTHVKTERQAFPADVSTHIMQTGFDTQGDSWGLRWATGFLTGARQGELLGLRWSEVDLEQGSMDIRWQLQELQKVHGCGGTCGRKRPAYCPEAKWEFDPGFEWHECERNLAWTRPKSRKAIRTVPLLDEHIVLLRALKARDGCNRHGLVFHHPDGSPFSPSRDRREWRELLESAKVDHQPLHSMRHSCATLLMERGIDGEVIKAVLGHSDVVTTRGYQHVDISFARQQIAVLKGLLP